MDRLFGDLGFKIHFAAYVAVNLLLVIINLLTTPHLLWFYWPLIELGIGLITRTAPRSPARATGASRASASCAKSWPRAASPEPISG